MKAHLSLKAFVTLVFCASLLASCQPPQPCSVTSELGQPFTLKMGECATVDRRISIEFEAVPEDSRCPLDVTCAWEGNAQVRLRWWIGDALPETFMLNTHSGFTRDTVIQGYRIALTDLQPGLYSYQDRDTIAYHARLMVTR